MKLSTIHNALPNPCLVPWFFFSGIIALNYLSNRLTECTCIFNVEIIIHLQKGFKLAHGRGSFLGCLHSFLAAALPQPVNPVLFMNIFLQISVLLDKGLIEMLLMPQACRGFDIFSNRNQMGRDEALSVPRGVMLGMQGGGKVRSNQSLAGCITSKPLAKSLL